MIGRRRRNPKLLTSEQLNARRENDKAELLVQILLTGISRRLKHYYGTPDDLLDLLVIIDVNLGNAIMVWKETDEHYKKVTEKKLVTKTTLVTPKTKTKKEKR